MTTLRSSEDASVNFLFPARDGEGTFEARYVRRADRPYFIGYLSSHAGCDKACRMCHLTQMGQTSMTPADLSIYAAQAARVMAHYAVLPPAAAEFMNWNFMARGEPLANPLVLGNFAELEKTLRHIAGDFRVPRCQMNLSTIMPREIEGRDLKDIIGPSRPGVNLYYSLYSMRPEFRRRWLPKAMDPEFALNMLTEWQMSGEGGEVVLHHALIKGENDTDEDAALIVKALKKRGLKTRFNLVRYNPFSPAQGEEANGMDARRILRTLGDAMGDPRTQIVPRVGRDVKASCGMFVEDPA